MICHEKAMQKQAKKMNIDSLRTKEEDQSIEVKIAKVIFKKGLWIEHSRIVQALCFLFILIMEEMVSQFH